MSLSVPKYRERWRNFKCCTFQPYINCVLAGAMLEQGMQVLDLPPERVHLCAIGLVPTRQYRKSLQGLLRDEQGAPHVCGFYDLEQRHCKVWQLRPGECSSYYCQTGDREPARLKLSEQLFDFEAGLAQMALVHLGFSAEAIHAQLDLLNTPPPNVVPLSRTEAALLYRKAWTWSQNVPQVEMRSWLNFDKFGRGL